MDNNIKVNIMFWNARSICKKQIETHNYLIDHDIQIALISETWCKKTVNIKFPNFHCYRLDREEGRGGGVAILIRKELEHQLLPDLGLTAIEAIGISIKVNGRDLSIFSVYFPGARRTAALSNFRGDIRRLTAVGSSYLICGDLNSRHRSWNCMRANRAGKVLFEENCAGNFMINYPHSPTYYPENSNSTPSTIDLMLTNGLCSISNLEVHNDLSSDHRPVTFSVGASSVDYVSENLVPCFNRADWIQFKNYLHDNISLDNLSSNLLRISDIDSMVEFITEKIQEAIDLSVPKVNPHVFQYIIPQNIRLLIRFRNARRRQWQRHHDPYIGQLVSFLNGQIRSAIQNFRNNEWSSLLSTIRATDHKFWKTTKILKRRQNIIPTLVDNGRKIFADQEKTDIIARKFSESHLLTLNDPGNPLMTQRISDEVAEMEDAQPVEVEASELTSPQEIRTVIKRLGRRKAPGVDRINNIVLKNLPRKAIVFLTYLFNACIMKQYFPKKWKHASVIAIPKPGKDPSDPKSYRPISLLCALSKLLERIILVRITQHMEEHTVLPNFQFGFRPHHSTCHQVVRITKHIKEGFRGKLSTGMFLLDIEKAFDTVWHDGLIYKMCHKNFPIYQVRIVRSFLSDRTFCVNYHGIDSVIYQIPAGLPQGATMSPTLYGIFTSDPPELLDCEIAAFADDTAIFTTHSNVTIITDRLQNAVEGLQSYFDSWKIKINPSKSQCIFFSKRRSPRYLPTTDLNIRNSNIAWSDNVKYLGVVLDRKLLFSSHIEYVLQKTEKMFKIFYSILNRRSRMNLKNKLILYKVALRSILLYCCPVWTNCAFTHRKRIQVMQNKFLKTILNLPWYTSTQEVHELAEVLPISELVEEISTKFTDRCQFSENPLIYSLFNPPS